MQELARVFDAISHKMTKNRSNIRDNIEVVINVEVEKTIAT